MFLGGVPYERSFVYFRYICAYYRIGNIRPCFICYYKSMGVLRNIGYMLLVVGIFYLLYKMFTNSSGSANSQSSYKRAAKQSNRKHGKQNVAP